MRHNQKGFTLVELIVTMSIAAILFAALTVGIAQYLRYAQFKRENEYAKTLYQAAQMQLTADSQLGQLGKYAEAAGGSGVPLEQLRFDGGASVTAASLWGSGETAYQGRVCYLRITSSDYAAYLAGGTADPARQAFFALFDAYVYNKTILNAAICVEFDPDEGLVYSVSYSDAASSFSYGDESGSVSILDRSTASRKARMVGYYGVESLSKSTAAETEKPSLTDVTLHNEETLNLTFRAGALASSMRYETVLLDAETDTALLTLQFNSAALRTSSLDASNYTLVAASAASVTHTVAVSVTDHQNPAASGIYLFPAWIEADGTVRLVLDAADLGATAAAYEAGTLQNTFSLHRFGVSAESVYCTVRGTASGGQTTAVRESNREQPYFGADSSAAAGQNKLYTIANARHLNNIRFSESDGTAATYTLTADVSWGDLVADGAVYRDQSTLTKESGLRWQPSYYNQFTNAELLLSGSDAFVSLAELGSGSVLCSAAGSIYAIRDMTLTQTQNNAAGVRYENRSAGISGAAGFLLLNSGTVRDLAFDNLRVTGESNVGTVCGVNNGALSQIEVRGGAGASVVTGGENAGGVFGLQLLPAGSGRTAEFSALVNRAEVRGDQNLGGIAGQISVPSGASVTLRGCENYGKIHTDENGVGRIGGILGSAVSKQTGGLALTGCVSTPLYGEAEIFENGVLTAALYGKDVGGIAGYCSGAVLTGCSTGRGGYVLGDEDVGGIVGYCSGDLAGDGSVNGAAVLGNTEVGGIVGRVTRNHSVSGWANEGVVIAQSAYAGGIAGSNLGTIQNCESEVQYDDAAQALQALASGDYAGGIAGYNNGTITADETVYAVSVVGGGSCVGGIVGENDTGAVLRNYALEGGYVRGKNHVGGLVGRNLTKALFSQQLSANPNEVAGDYCVGGVIGTNIIDLLQNQTAQCAVYNILGSVSGKAFVGGMIGAQFSTSGSAWFPLAGQAAEALDGLLTDDPAETVSNLRNWYDSTGYAGYYVLELSGDELSLRQVAGDRCVGGAVGFCAEGSPLVLKNIVNKTPVSASSSAADALQGSGDTAQYSYAGGIIGLVSSTVIVDGCSSESAVTAPASYRGGIAEVNQGLIYRCGGRSGGSAAADGIGGIVGLNMPKEEQALFGVWYYLDDNYSGAGMYVGGGVIRHGVYDCTFGGTLTGRTEVGSIAACNRGVIHDPQISGTVSGYGSRIGGVAGSNLTDGRIELSSTLTLDVTGSGAEVGGVVGENSGTLTAGGDAADCVTAGTVRGAQFVGGLVGRQKNDMTYTGLCSGAAVTASAGSAGGIVGAADGSVSFRSCKNIGAVQTVRSGSAGGILPAVSAGTDVTGCSDTGSVSAPNGSAGGIAAENSGTISGCTVSAEAEPVAVAAGQNAGGIAGSNAGTMTSCSAVNLTVSDFSGSAPGSLGGLSGENSGTILLGSDSLEQVTVTALQNGCNAGGAAGRNTGTISASGSGAALGTGAGSLTLSLRGSAVYGNLGGAAGVNEGTMSGFSVAASVEGALGTSSTPENGYGGAAGVNSGKIIGLSFDGSVYADGTSNAISTEGGIAGLNLAAGVISDCTVGVSAETTILCGQSAYSFGYLGGVAGWNQGTILSCDNAQNSGAAVSVIGYAGHVGGIAGFNDETGTATGESADRRLSTGKNWRVESKYYSNNCGTGGILGYSASGSDLRYTDNYALVLNSSGLTSNVAVGGLVGRLENRDSYDFRISDCRNYGQIFSSLLTGGFVGRWKYRGGTVENCVNYGSVGVKPAGVSKQDSTSAAGLVASFYYLDAGCHVSFYHCENHGVVTAGGSNSCIAAGICATGDTTSITLNLTDCVNTGVLTGNQCAGIAYLYRTTLGQFARCRNYGLSAAGSASKFCGICCGASGSITDCLDFSNAYYPVSGSKPGVFQGNFYVTRTNATAAGAVYADLLTAKAQGKWTTLLNAGGDSVLKKLADNPTGTGAGQTAGGASASGLAFTADYSAYGQDSFRYTVIDELESALVTYDSDTFTTQPLISGASVLSLGGAYALTWQSQIYAYAYEVRYDAPDGTVQYETGDRYAAVDLEDAWTGNAVTFYVRGIYWGKNGKQTETDWVAVPVAKVLKPLPTPVVHLELTGDSSYVALLDNAQDYRMPDGALLDAKILYSISGVGSVSFTVSDGRSAPIALNTKGNKVLTVQAQSSGLTAAQQLLYSNSSPTTVQAALFGANYLKSTDYCKTAFTGFSGDGSASMEYLLSLTPQSSGVETYYLSEILTYDAAVGAEVAESWGESHVTSFGQTVVSALPAGDASLWMQSGTLTVRTYPWRTQSYQSYFGHVVAASATAEEVKALTEGGVPILENGAPAAGYSVQKNNDGTYRVIYSAILADADFYGKQIDQTTYTIDAAKQTVKYGASTAKMQRPPVLDDPQETGGGYRFAWDTGKKEPGASYRITLTGIAVDGTEVELASRATTGADYDSASGGWFADFSDADWNYPNLRFQVVRLGSVNSAGMTTVYPAAAEKTYNLKIRLRKIAAPTVTFHVGDTGLVAKDDLIYDVTWTPAENAVQYEITAAYSDAGGAEQTLLFRTGDSLASAKAVIDSASPAIYSGSAGTAVLNLNALDGLSEARISVRAIADAGSAVYRSGPDGDEETLTLPKRLAVPDPSSMTVDRSAGDVLSAAEFTATLSMAQTYAQKGSYELTLEIVRRSGSADTVVRTLADAGHPRTMAGTLAGGTALLSDLLADDAGLWLRVGIRAVGNSDISSVWSFESGIVQHYAYFRLPVVRLDTPAVSETTQSVSYSYGADGEYSKTLTQTALQFRTVSNAGRYEVQLIEAPQSSGSAWRTPAASLTLTPAAGGFDVTWQSTDSLSEVQKLGTLGKGGTLTLPYTASVPVSAADTVQTKAALRLSADGGTVTLLLPDSGSVRATQNMTVQAIPSDAVRYADSKIGCWYRTKDNTAEITATAVLDQAAEAPFGIVWSAAVSKTSGVLYELTAASDAPAEAEITCGGKTLCFSVPAADQGGTYALNLPLETAFWSAYQGQTVSIRTRTLSASGGAGRYTAAQPLTLPAIP